MLTAGPAFVAMATGLLLSFAILALLRPALRAPWRWAWQGVALHGGLWLVLHALLLIVLGRPWFAMTIGLAFLLLLTQVSNAKYRALREVFVFQDFEYFTDAIRYPRLYIPFLGWWNFALIIVGVLAALGVGLRLEVVPENRFLLAGQLGDVIMFFAAGMTLIGISTGGPKAIFQPDVDMRRLGFLAVLWRYGWAERSPMRLPVLLPETLGPASDYPDLLVVQSESFFDPRSLLASIRPDVLAEFDRLNAEAVCHGRLAVPAWGANTVRSEFAFLSGATEAMLGVHRFNPYRQVRKSKLLTLAGLLKAAGYRTVCVHPYPASFYGRAKVYPHLGFDEFIDIRSFEGAERSGPYISDLAVSEKVRSLIREADGPIFVFVITMENHGPLHLEKACADDVISLYTENPPSGCDDLTIYLRHLRNADKMIGDLRGFLAQHSRPARFCWYGDHVPIMADAYRQLGDPDGQTAYCIWSNQPAKKAVANTICLHTLASRLLDIIV